MIPKTTAKTIRGLRFIDATPFLNLDSCANAERKQNFGMCGLTDGILFFKRSHASSVTRVRKNWFSRLTTHAVTLTDISHMAYARDHGGPCGFID
jgi:hypothetical protein